MCHPKDQPATERSWCEVMATVRSVVQDSRARVFAHLPEIGLPLLANSGQPGSGHPGTGVVVGGGGVMSEDRRVGQQEFRNTLSSEAGKGWQRCSPL